jgi:hypothetical protein
MNLKRIVEKRNASTFQFPKGWLTKAEAAEQLDCSEERVNDILRHAIRAGDVERQEFPVWDATLGRVVRVTGYRESGKPTAPAAPTNASRATARPASKVLITPEVQQRIAAFVSAHGGPACVTPAQVRHNVRVRLNGQRFPLPLDEVAAVLARL